jgi:hypothetical protein
LFLGKMLFPALWLVGGGGFKRQGGGIDAIPKPCRGRAVFKNMSQMSLAAAAYDFHAHPPAASVDAPADASFLLHIIKRRPAAMGGKLGFRGKQNLPAAGTFIHPFFKVIIILACIGGFGAGLPQDMVLLRREELLPIVIRLGNFFRRDRFILLVLDMPSPFCLRGSRCLGGGRGGGGAALSRLRYLNYNTQFAQLFGNIRLIRVNLDTFSKVFFGSEGIPLAEIEKPNLLVKQGRVGGTVEGFLIAGKGIIIQTLRLKGPTQKSKRFRGAAGLVNKEFCGDSRMVCLP